MPSRSSCWPAWSARSAARGPRAFPTSSPNFVMPNGPWCVHPRTFTRVPGRPFPGWIRACGWIRGTGMHRIHPGTRIDPDSGAGGEGGGGVRDAGELRERVEAWIADDPDAGDRAELRALADRAFGGSDAAALAELRDRFAGRGGV